MAGMLAVVHTSLPAQERKAEPPAIKTTTQEVVLDMVFRTKKGKTVRDIRPEEIHVFEDGVEQKLNSFRLLEGNNAIAVEKGGTTGAPVPLDPMKEIRLVTLVFENLDVEGRRFFRQAVKDLLDMTREPNLYVSVFVIDQKLHCLQPFTLDHRALLASLDRAATWSFIQYSNQSTQVKESLAKILSTDAPQLAGGQAGGPTATQTGGMVNWRLAKMQFDMLQAADRADREFDVRATMSALSGLVREESKLPGRKVVLYFNPWFSISEAVKERYGNLVGAANRGNVTFYTVDTKGLVTYSQGGAGRDQLRGVTDETRRLSQSGGAGMVSTEQARAGENAESAARSNPLLWLRDLAQNTGGSTIAETNDWKAPLSIVMEEVRTYYEATYVPQIATYDGKFRKIAVKVDRPDVLAHARSGYYALPSLGGGQQLASFELPLLNALGASPAPAGLPFRAAAQRFSDRGPRIEYMLTVEAPLKTLTFETDAAKKSANVNAALLAVLKDERGEVVEKFSKEFDVQVDADKVDGYKEGNLVQTFRTTLVPGKYSLETAVADRKSNNLAVKKTTLDVPQPSSKLSLSNVVVVRRADVLKNNEILDAFYYEGGKIVPTLTDTLKGGPGSILPFYFAVFRDPASQEPPRLTMSFYMNGQFLGAAEAPLPPPQKDGRIPYIASLPGDKFVPGAYEIHVGVLQGQEKAEEKIAFRIN
jgi:VWFA-related protein